MNASGFTNVISLKEWFLSYAAGRLKWMGIRNLLFDFFWGQYLKKNNKKQ
ncbi:MAG: hypothetical protein MJZ34_01515 [Paludibacteraceae bacterium]|nr:hypothetical protein [Paludibacteraceae bacterium]